MKLTQKQKNGLEFLMYAKTRQHYGKLAIENAAKTLLSMKKSRSPKKKSRRSKKSRSPKRKSKADKLRRAAQLWKSRQ